MKPEIISLGRKIALHMMNEDALFEEIINSSPTEEEAVFLAQMIFRKNSITRHWKRD